jgi:hypothetical protein
MAADNPKNLALGPAAADLGLGASLQQQTQDQVEDMRRKKRSAMGLNQQNLTGVALGPATSSLLGGLSGGGLGN